MTIEEVARRGVAKGGGKRGNVPCVFLLCEWGRKNGGEKGEEKKGKRGKKGEKEKKEKQLELAPPPIK